MIQRAWDVVQFFLCLGIVTLLPAYLTIWYGHSGQTQEDSAAIGLESDVSITGPSHLAIRPDSPIFQKLQITTVELTETTDPVVSVTGVDVASLQTNGNGNGGDHLADIPVGADNLGDFWQFYSTELFTAFTDGRKRSRTPRRFHAKTQKNQRSRRLRLPHISIRIFSHTKTRSHRVNRSSCLCASV